MLVPNINLIKSCLNQLQLTTIAITVVDLCTEMYLYVYYMLYYGVLLTDVQINIIIITYLLLFKNYKI